MKSLEEYLRLPYEITLVDESSDGRKLWSARIDDLPGCSAQGPTSDRATARVRDAKEAWLAAALERGEPVPEPRTLEDHSGRFVVRVPRSLHARLVREARREGTSLNQLVTGALAGAVGWRDRREAEGLDLIELDDVAMATSSKLDYVLAKEKPSTKVYVREGKNEVIEIVKYDLREPG